MNKSIGNCSDMIRGKLLIVDDSKTARNFVRSWLQHLDLEITEAIHGQQGFELAASNMYDLIISDIDMPLMNGFEMCKLIKRNPSTNNVPVIMLSANDSDDSIECGFKVGADAYVSKNRAGTDLAILVKELLNRSQILRGRVVLIVDDSQFIRTMIREGLIKAGFITLEASDGRQALEIMGTRQPDFIISDINMPVMDGITLLKEVRALGGARQIPFMIVSSENDHGLMRRVIQMGATAFMVKPFNVGQLVLNIETLLSNHVQLLLAEQQRLTGERQMLLHTISSLINALEARDPYTRGHSEAVSRYAKSIAVKMGFDSADMENLQLAAKLHDIGKIGIRDDVLLKASRLTDDEFTQIKDHPLIGADILRPISSLAEIEKAVLQHHEKLDGTGYPHGLKGKEIHHWAKIISVADVYHALTSARPYRRALPPKTAFQILMDMSGRHLCPECVRKFLEIQRPVEMRMAARDCPQSVVIPFAPPKAAAV